MNLIRFGFCKDWGVAEATRSTRSVRFPLSVVALLAVLLSAPASSGRPPQVALGADGLPNPQTMATHVIRVNSNLVIVPVSVTDSKGELVKGLESQDFTIEENGVSESIAKMAEPGETPLELALLFDISGSVQRQFEFEQQAANRFLQKIMRPEDAVTIFSIAQQPRLVLPRTESLAKALRALDALEPTQGITAFYDAVASAARSLGENSKLEARRVELVLSDGEDNNSTITKLTDVLDAVQRGDCVFYSINPSGPSIRLNKLSLKGQEEMEKLASETGGMAFVPETPASLDAIFTQIGAELKAQYLLEYYSSDSRFDGAFRHIVVRVPKRPDLRIRARQGYYPPSS